MNWAEVSNKGIEFALSTENIRTPNFRWKMDFNIAHNTSNVDKIQVREIRILLLWKDIPLGLFSN